MLMEFSLINTGGCRPSPKIHTRRFGGVIRIRLSEPPPIQEPIILFAGNQPHHLTDGRFSLETSHKADCTAAGMRLLALEPDLWADGIGGRPGVSWGVIALRACE
jgi:hypothetical protein